MYYKIKIIVLFLITGVAVNMALAQVPFTSKKVGDDPFTIKNKSAVLEVESTKGGFLPPRMKMVERNLISSPPAGLIIWCDDCNKNPPVGGLCTYLSNSTENKGGWVSLPLITTPPELTTGKMTDANKPVKLSANSARISGTLVSTSGFTPIETGVVWREIIGNDFDTLPVLDAATGEATIPTRKTTGTLVTADGAAISVDITGLTSKRPYFFRTYARTSPWSIGYGNPVIFNVAPPTFSTPVVTNTTPLAPTFSGTLTINASTPPDTVTEYGYCSSTTNTKPTILDNKVQLSTPEALATLNTQLSAASFTANPVINLVNNYDVTAIAPTYFIYYVTADRVTTYSNVVSFTPLPDPVTGGTARAAMTSKGDISKPLKAGEYSSSSFIVKFNVTKAGSYNFATTAPTGATLGLTMPAVKGEFLTTGDNQELTFNVIGLPKSSLEGNTFAVAGVEQSELSTGRIQRDATVQGNIDGGKAFCGATDKTEVTPVFSSMTGRIWMDRNLGASQQAVSVTDYLAFGCLYQWGRGNDGHASITWTDATTGTPVNGVTNTLATTDTPVDASFIISIATPFDWRSPQNNNLWQGVNGINNPCPAGYRIPIITELMAEGEAYSIINNQKAFESDLRFVPVPWRRTLSGSLEHVLNEDGNYWSSSVSGVLSSTLVCFDGIPVGHYHGFGYSVRCIKN